MQNDIELHNNNIIIVIDRLGCYNKIYEVNGWKKYLLKYWIELQEFPQYNIYKYS